MDRRSFIKLSTFAGASVAISTGLAGCVSTQQPQDNATFTHGVASGDPLHDSVILWTRAIPESSAVSAHILWEVSTSKDFSSLVASDVAKAEQSRDFTVKVDVKGLQPATRYYYRFRSASQTSVVGTTLTLPKENVDQVTFGVFSCSNYPAGFFTPYADAATRTDIDYVLHLGDYIYEYGGDGYATEHAKALGRTFAENNNSELLTLEDYRNRYAIYRTDQGLLDLHQGKPFIVVWDDHEVANDTYKDGAQNHQQDEGDFYARRAAAVQAYYEWLPIRPTFGESRLEIYRQFSFGNLVDLYMLDTRVLARDKQLNYDDFRDPETKAFDLQGFTAAISAPERGLLGKAQRTWLNSAMQESTAKWQVLGQQLLIGRMTFPASIFNGVPFENIPAHVHALANSKRKQLAGEAISEQEAQMLATAMPYNLDAWDGYPVERETLLTAVQKLNKPVIALAGDTHNAWHNRLTLQDGTPVATELGTASVSSPGMEHYLKMDEATAKVLAEDLPVLIDDLQYCNLHQRGYLTVSFTPEQAVATWRFVDSIQSPSVGPINTHEFVIES
ncbi:alkaline phosphatase D family protein [Alteromonas sp. 14N.309.X.WAT.G.H12]|uniref:alkaline phosphatase D family protein n=1 Tax=Alteromonas sp. 14N.309.X.WAT.G.H12 TaxID=3120824 RepID=UPI002FD256A6